MRRAAIAAIKQTMTRWQYSRMYVYQGPSCSWRGPKGEARELGNDLVEALNHLGQLGWELVGFEVSTYVFKVKIED